MNYFNHHFNLPKKNDQNHCKTKRNFLLTFSQLLLVIALGLLSRPIEAQVFIDSAASMQVGMLGQVGIHDSILNKGTIGLDGASKIYLIGDVWSNQNNAQMTGQGKVVFKGSSIQTIRGNAPTTMFPSIELENSNNVYLASSDCKVADTVNFISGKIVLNDYDFTVGNNNPGIITGYNQDRYFVTNGSPQSTKGHLIREKTGSATVAFPVGLTTTEYTPASISN
ncbi:MAG: hypothetical protein HYZ42_05265, partial [Bacteroidetes bacterium]|nr:hypothetical protein [Bacteroidota bacterium]